MLDTLQPETAPPLFEESKCEQCQSPFAPRSHSGGKPQRFCSPECRTSFHAGQRSQHTPTCSEHPTLAAVRQPPKRTPTTRDRKDDWEWWHDPENQVDIVQRRIDGIAIYENNDDNIVIRSARRDEDEDTVIIVSRGCLMAVIDKLCDLAGIGSAGRNE